MSFYLMYCYYHGNKFINVEPQINIDKFAKLHFLRLWIDMLFFNIRGKKCTQFPG